MKLYGHPYDACTRKVLLTLAEKGARAELVLVDLAIGQHTRPEHRRRHPFGTVPVIQHQDLLLYESSAILRYLDDVLAGPALVPRSAPERARMDQWMSVEASYLEGPARILASQLLLAPSFGQEPDSTLVARARADLAVCLDVLELALCEREFLAGDSFSLAEVVCMPRLQFLEDALQGDLIVARPRVSAWWAQLRQRASWRDVLRADAWESFEQARARRVVPRRLEASEMGPVHDCC